MAVVVFRLEMRPPAAALAWSPPTPGCPASLLVRHPPFAGGVGGQCPLGTFGVAAAVTKELCRAAALTPGKLRLPWTTLGLLVAAELLMELLQMCLVIGDLSLIHI